MSNAQIVLIMIFLSSVYTAISYLFIDIETDSFHKKMVCLRMYVYCNFIILTGYILISIIEQVKMQGM